MTHTELIVSIWTDRVPNPALSHTQRPRLALASLSVTLTPESISSFLFLPTLVSVEVPIFALWDRSDMVSHPQDRSIFLTALHEEFTESNCSPSETQIQQ